MSDMDPYSTERLEALIHELERAIERARRDDAEHGSLRDAVTRLEAAIMAQMEELRALRVILDERNGRE